ncbi:hypothetical protein [Sandaracinus amylolyticus]|uniref:hypothetical protein n=1 Tax=Sandaracinus amylolyticus TaxID=927083 RepID=UPI001F22F30A|nr:hypothetical protein [Sandaracinus amylolyticus]UJR81182.1 Hypothetical protein I5071_32370 [Sandaracinus amylolyticus]
MRPTRFGRRAAVGAAVSLVLALTGPGCGGNSAVGDTPRGSRGDQAVREQCNPQGREVRAVDVNNDANPDIRHVYEGGVERCAQYDMNFDGMIDVTRFFAEDGSTPIREEHDFDFDGRLDQISYLENGVVVRSELDTNFDNVIDTWLWCEGNLLSRSERDRRHGGRPDTWEEFESGVLHEARYDENNDGQPDRWEVFERGRLTQIRRDTDVDGQPDQTEDIPADSAGQAETPMTCDGSEVAAVEEPPAPPPAAPATTTDTATSGGEAPPAEGTTQPGDAGAQPFGGTQ